MYQLVNQKTNVVIHTDKSATACKNFGIRLGLIKTERSKFSNHVLMGDWIIRKTKRLTKAYVQKAIANDPRFDQEIDDHPDGQIGVWLKDGWTWCANDGNRHVEILNLTDEATGEADTVEYWREIVANIEKEI